jgi:hypothetical protein
MPASAVYKADGQQFTFSEELHRELHQTFARLLRETEKNQIRNGTDAREPESTIPGARKGVLAQRCKL